MGQFDAKDFVFCKSPFWVIFRTFALSKKCVSSSTPIHKVQLPNLLVSVILLLF